MYPVTVVVVCWDLRMVLCSYPNDRSPCVFQIASKVAAPLSKTNEIVILSGEGSRVTGEVTRLLAELPVSVNALTGVDLTKVPLKSPFCED